MKKILFAIALTLCTLLSASAQKRQDVNVLYVGGSAELETMGLEVQPDPAVLAASAAERTASFTKFLKKNFRKVTVVDAKDYNWQMSSAYDVTIIDGRPEPISAGIRDVDANGNMTRYALPQYFPLNFDRAVITIADAGEQMGRRVGTKNDWYCLCLEDQILGWNEKHPVFQGPVKVVLNPKDQPTPASAQEYASLCGETLPATVPMVKMQDINYETDRDYRIGMVSRPGGYLDSPETEVISGGKCGKSIDAVAIGRHANWMTWGFSASPAHMTDVAKALFVNAVVYMKQFNGQHPVARKLDEGVATRDHIVMTKHLLSRAGYEAYREMLEASNKEFKAVKDSLNAIIAAGGEIDPNYAIYLQIPEQPIPPFREYMRERAKELYPVFGEDTEEYARYYDRNYGYFYCPYESYDLVLDQEARYFGIANNDKALLEKCISVLEEGGEDSDDAMTVLRRYTLCRFATAKEWRDWYETYKDKLFFTESGGYLWLVDTMEDVPGNDYNVLLNEAEAKYAEESGMVSSSEGPVTDNRNPVYFAAKAQATDRGEQIVIYQQIHDGYHTYAVVPSDQPFVATEIEFELPQGYTLSGRLYTPAVSLLDASGTTVFKGTGEYRQGITGEGGGEATIKIHYQCCNSNGCLAPTTKTIKINL